MFGKSKSKSTNASSTTSVKRPAPPRPPPPSTNIPRSASVGFDSFDPWNEQKSKPGPLVRTQTVGCSYNITNRSDLIDLSSPSNSPPKSTFVSTPNFPGVTSNEVPDFKYHIGASIFYVKSELKSTPSSSKPTANPFSPPRPSPQSLLSKTAPAIVSTATNKKPTIIKANTQTAAEPQNNNYYGGTNNQVKSPPVLLDWDEPPKKAAAPVSLPTVIRPVPPPKKPGLASMRLGDRNSITGPPPPFVPPPVTKAMLQKEEPEQPRYEEPPEESDDEFEDSFQTVPEPAEACPPPPPQELNDFADSADQLGYSSSNPSFQNYIPDASDRAYGIALYDYISGEPGDLQFAVGDVIYLIRSVDESWLYGSCAGLEGIFPSNFINIVVPLEGQLYADVNSGYDNQSALNANDQYTDAQYFPTHYVSALHDFEATEPNDLTIQDGDIVTVIGQVNEDWLYGELHGRKGQFPAAFLEYVPGNLPLIDPKAQ